MVGLLAASTDEMKAASSVEWMAECSAASMVWKLVVGLVVLKAAHLVDCWADWSVASLVVVKVGQMADQLVASSDARKAEQLVYKLAADSAAQMAAS